jgi:hypothetical protein
MSLRKQITYGSKVLPGGTWRALGAAVREPVHLIMAVADHFEPAIDPEDGQKRVPRHEQERRLDWWSREYPKAADHWRDHEGRPVCSHIFLSGGAVRRGPTPNPG